MIKLIWTEPVKYSRKAFLLACLIIPCPCISW